MQRTHVYLIRLKSAYLGAKCSHSIVALLLLPPPPQVNEDRTTRRQRSRSERRRYTLGGVTLSFFSALLVLPAATRTPRRSTQRLAPDTVVVRAVHPPPFSSSYSVSSLLISSSLVSCRMPSSSCRSSPSPCPSLLLLPGSSTATAGLRTATGQDASPYLSHSSIQRERGSESNDSNFQKSRKFLLFIFDLFLITTTATNYKQQKYQLNTS